MANKPKNFEIPQPDTSYVIGTREYLPTWQTFETQKIDKISKSIDDRVSTEYDVTPEDLPGMTVLVGTDDADALVTNISAAYSQLLYSIIDFMGGFTLENDSIDRTFIYENLFPDKPQITKTMTLGQTIARLGAVLDIGEFVVPQIILDYIEEDKHRSDTSNYGHLTNASIEKGKVCVQNLMSLGFNSYAALALAGSIYVECGFSPHSPNTLELNGGGVSGTKGWAGAGEGLCGVTFWPTKQKVIQASGVNLSSDKETYNRSDSRHISDLSEEEHYKIYDAYLKVSVPKFRKILMESKDPLEILFASYLYKAGPAYKPNFEGVKKCVESYIRTHLREYGKAINGFCKQISASIDIAVAMNKDKKKR